MSEHFDSEYEDDDLEEASLEDDLDQEEYEDDFEDGEYDEEHAEADDEEIDEEISTAEVDRVLETLTTLMEDIESDTVHSYLEEAYHGIFQLVYEEDESDEEDGFGSHSDAA